MLAFLPLLANIVGLVPGLENLAAQWHATALEAQVQQFIAKTGATRDVALASIQANAQVQTKWWFVALVPPLFAFPYVIWNFKAVAVDKVICPVLGLQCSTDPLDGVLGSAFLMILGFYFLHGMKSQPTK